MDGDHHILEKVKKGDVNAFAEIVQKHQRPLICVLLRMVGDLELAEDIAQEAFMKAYTKLESFQGRSKFKSWLFQIGINTAKNRLRSRKREVVDIQKVRLSVGEHQDLEIGQKDVQGTLSDEIGKLPPKQRLALSLRIYEDLSFAEIAEIMKCPYDTAKANYRHALMKLRHKLGKSMDLKDWTVNNIHHRTVEADI